jgi:hypothetical protein
VDRRRTGISGTTSQGAQASAEGRGRLDFSVFSLIDGQIEHAWFPSQQEHLFFVGWLESKELLHRFIVAKGTFGNKHREMGKDRVAEKRPLLKAFVQGVFRSVICR